MGYTTSYWQKERWSRRVADMLTSYELCWNPSLGTWDVEWRVGGACQGRKCIREFSPARVTTGHLHSASRSYFRVADGEETAWASRTTRFAFLICITLTFAKPTSSL